MPRFTEKICMSCRPSQKLGSEMPAMAMSMPMRSSARPRLMAATTPMMMPNSTDQVIEQMVR